MKCQGQSKGLGQSYMKGFCLDDNDKAMTITRP